MRGKRLIAAGVAAATLAGGAYAFAANLTVTSQNLGAGTSPVASTCTGLDVDYKTTYDSSTTPPGSKKYFVTEIDLNHRVVSSVTQTHNCTTEFYKVTVDLFDGTTHSTKEYKGQLAAGSGTVDSSSTPALGLTDLDASQVVNIAAVVTSGLQS